MTTNSNSVVTKIKRLLLLVFFIAVGQQLFAQTKNAIDSLLKVLNMAGEDTIKVKILNNLSDQYRRAKQYSESRKYVDEAMVLAGKLNYKKGIASAYRNIGLNYEYQKNNEEAIKYFQLELKILEELGDRNSIAYTNVYIGEIYYQMNNFPESRKWFLASLKIAQEMGYKWREMLCYNYLGIISHMEGKYSESLKNYFNGLKISQERKDTTWITLFYHNMGNTYLDL